MKPETRLAIGQFLDQYGEDLPPDVIDHAVALGLAALRDMGNSLLTIPPNAIPHGRASPTGVSSGGTLSDDGDGR